ncbi:hypothetical protein Fmac_011346 [Flemingia macrophylla]|uniref:Uncharacterized protein n=1 Tax=Flemingia macrophylla TaxID=520843 RepID=A0ABD1MM61_9FABA
MSVFSLDSKFPYPFQACGLKVAKVSSYPFKWRVQEASKGVEGLLGRIQKLFLEEDCMIVWKESMKHMYWSCLTLENLEGTYSSIIESADIIHDPITTTSSVSASSHTFHRWKQNASSVSTHTMLEMSQAYLGRKSCVMVGAPRFVQKLLMVVIVKEAIAVLSTVSLEDEQPEVQGPGVWVSSERSAIESLIDGQSRQITIIGVSTFLLVAMLVVVMFSVSMGDKETSGHEKEERKTRVASMIYEGHENHLRTHGVQEEIINEGLEKTQLMHEAEKDPMTKQALDTCKQLIHLSMGS